MAKKPKVIVTCKEDYTHIIPADEIVVKDFHGNVVNRIPVPEHRVEYKSGKEIEFRTKKEAKEFVTAHRTKGFHGFSLKENN